MNKWLLCALAVCLTVSVSSGQDILVFDLPRAVDECDEHADLVGKLKKEAADLKTKYGDRVKQLQVEQKTLLEKTLSLRSAKWYVDVKKSLMKEGELKAIEAFHRVEIGDKILRGMQALMLSAREAANEIRKERGAKVVLVSKTAPIRFESENDLKDELLNRRVISIGGKADITNDVLKRMNAAYKARKKALGNVRSPKKDAAKKDANK